VNMTPRSSNDVPTASMPKPLAKPRFVLTPFDQIVISPAPRYAIKGLIPRSGLVVIWGAPKAGKSFFALSTAMHIAMGWDFDGRKVRQGTVVYVAPEGHHGFPARVEAFRQTFLAEASDSVPFHLVASAINLAKDYRDLVVDIRRALGSEPPAAIYIDTVNRSLGGSENDDNVLGAYVDAALEIGREFGCATILIHHSGYETSRMRGHSLLPAALDAELQVEKTGEGITVTVKNMREGADGETVGGKIEIVTVGEDTEGDPITSCVFRPIAGGGERPSKERSAKLPAGTKMLLKTLGDLLLDNGKAIRPFGATGPEVRAVDRETLRTEFYNRWPVDGVTDKAKADARRQQFSRSERYAITKQIIVSREMNGATLTWMGALNSPAQQSDSSA